MDPLGATASIIAALQLSSKVLGYLNDVKNASKDRANCTREAANLYSLLTALRFRLEEEGNSSTSWYTATRSLAIENGPLDQFKQALEQLQSRMTGDGRLGQASNALVWNFKTQEIAGILGRMERLKTLVEIALQMDHLKLSKAIKDDVDLVNSKVALIKENMGFVRTQVPTILSGLDTIQNEQDRLRHDTLMAWLSKLNFSAQQSDILGRRQEGTGQWFLDDPALVQWLQGPKGTLLCPGIPGAGKTMIAAIAIDHLQKSVQSNSVGVAYVYCSYKAHSEQNVTSLLSALLKQLVQAKPSIVESVEQLHKKHAASHTTPSADNISGALQSVITEFSTVHIVVDALDECKHDDGTRHRFLDQLRALQAKSDVRLMITSRHIPEILDQFREAPTVEVRASDDDVRRFVAGQVYRLPGCIQRDTSLRDLVESKVVDAVEGMFLLARLHVDSLLDKRTKSRVLSMLDTMRGGFQSLNKAYDDAIDRIKGQLPEDTTLGIRVLSWITNAQSPLTTAEICLALAVEPNTNHLDTDNVPDIDDLVSVCAGLVTVDQESNIIRLVHYTTQEYLERTQQTWNPGAQLDIAATCLTYLSFDIFKSTEDWFNLQISFDQRTFLIYAAEHWGQHALDVQAELCELACSFLLRRSSVLNINKDRIGGRTGLHITAQFGLQLLATELLSRTRGKITLSINARDDGGQTPLSLAVMFGHEKITALLLDNGADIDAKCGSSRTPLQIAAFYGHDRIVRLLLDRGADINNEGAFYGSALHAASYRGHSHIVTVLLDNGAIIDAHTGYSGSALGAATSCGHYEVVALLLQNGADVQANSKYWSEVLYAASTGGYERIVKLLLTAGVDINSKSDDLDWNALQIASWDGHQRAVELLLDNGADINARGGLYGTALQAASYLSHEFTVRLLIDRGADVNVQCGLYGNALQAACARFFELNKPDNAGARRRIVELLLDKGADISARGGKYGSAFSAAAYHNSWDLVELLYDAKADVTCSSAYNGPFLHSLAFSGRSHFLRRVCGQLNPDPHQKDFHGRTILHIAARGRDLDTFDLHQTDFHGRTILHMAARGGDLDTFNYLLELGLDPAAKDAAGAGVLHYASSGGSVELLESILDRSLLLCADDGQWSPLHWACRAGNGKVVERLIERNIYGGQVVTTQPDRSWSPSSIALLCGYQHMLDELCASSRSLLDAKDDKGLGDIHSDPEPTSGISTKFLCDACYQYIPGPRFHCHKCIDFDYCLMCKHLFGHLHRDHSWDYIEQ